MSYFRAYEDQNVRRDENEGTATYRPEDGLIINNNTQGKTFRLTGHAFESTARHDEIFVFCTSRSASDQHRQQFEAVACVEVLKIRTLCERIKAALPPQATFFGRRVEYYDAAEAGNPRWALPENIATSKLRDYAWQDEYRLVFSVTDALAFENVALRIVRRDVASEAAQAPQKSEHLVATASLRDFCRLHEF